MKNISRIIIHGILIILSIMFIVPIMTIVSISISNEVDIMEYGYSLIPRSIDWSAYEYIFRTPKMIFDAYKVSIFVSAFGTICSIFLMMMCAYALSRKNYRFRKVLNFLLFFTMLFSGGLVPKYILMTQYLHLQNTVWVLILSHLVNVWNLFILRTFIQGIPESMMESAEIDGASEFRIFISLVIPLSKPAIATIGLFVLLGYWNEWQSAMLYISESQLYPLQYLLQRVMQNLQQILQNMDKMSPSMLAQVDVPSETVRMALAIVSAGPMLFIMPFFQKYFVRGMTLGSVKG